MLVRAGIVIQGEAEEELPEKLLGCFTLNHIDLSFAQVELLEE
jgi:hypothetical protein